MTFTENIKSEAKTKAHYKCCVCNSFEFIEVHHIIPQEEKGPDTLENAAPLCTRCHKMYGGNKDLIKWIKDKRDFWYKFCKEKLFNEDINELKKLSDAMEKIQNNHESRITSTESDIAILKNSIIDLTNKNNILAQSLTTARPSEYPVIFNQISSGAITVSGAALFMGELEKMDKQLTKAISHNDDILNEAVSYYGNLIDESSHLFD